MMVDALTTNKTDFFRESAHFDFLTRFVRDGRIKAAGQRPIRIWSAGCSTGEEPYTIAMVMEELCREIPGLDYQILATDISPSCLSEARQAVYDERKLEPVSEALKKRYVLRGVKQKHGLLKIAPELRARITFEPFNLMTPAFTAMDSFDLIFCRNVMIYFSAQKREQLVDQFRRQLVPGGIFFIGHSEGIATNKSRFTQLQPATYQRPAT